MSATRQTRLQVPCPHTTAHACTRIALNTLGATITQADEASGYHAASLLSNTGHLVTLQSWLQHAGPHAALQIVQVDSDDPFALDAPLTSYTASLNHALGQLGIPPVTAADAVQALPQPQVYPPIAPALKKSRSTALVLEMLLPLLGFFGVGWLYAGKVEIGITLLVVMLLWSAFAFFFLVGMTLGLGCLCTIPISLGVMSVSAWQLNRHMQERPEQFQ